MDHDQAPHPSMAHPSGSEYPIPQSEHTHAITPATMDNHTHRHDVDASDSEQGSRSPQSRSTAERRLFNTQESHFATDPNADLERGPVPPPPTARSRDSRNVRVSESPRHRTSGPMNSHQHDPYLDHVVPTSAGNGHGGHKSFSGQSWAGPDGMEWGGSQHRSLGSDKKVKHPEISWECGSIGSRLAPTIRYAEAERERYARRAQYQSHAINLAIGLQVLLGALTTALSAAVTSAKQESGLATIVASYLARVRGSGEPELSIMRVKDLEHFIRDCRGFELDHGHEGTTDHHHCPVNRRLLELRQKFEDLINASGEKKLSATGITSTGTTSAGAALTGNRTN